MNKAEIRQDNARAPMSQWLRPWLTAAIQRRAVAPPTLYRLFPNMNCEVFVNLAEHHTSPRFGAALRPLPVASLFGPKSQPYEHATGAISDWFLIQLTPLGVRQLIGCPVSSVVDADHDLADLMPHAAALVEQIAMAGDFAERLDIVERWAMSRLCKTAPSARTRTLSHLHEIMRASPTLSIESLAARLDLTPRRFRTLAGEEFGLSPKALLGHFRMEKAWTELHRHRSIAGASELFADQAHFSREFQRFTGLTPKSYCRLKASGDGIINGFACAAAESLGLLPA